MQTGLDRLLRDADRLARLRGQRVALLANLVGVVPVPQRHGLTGGFGWPSDSVWVNQGPAIANLRDQTLRIDEDAWAEERRPFLIYG
jgi:hypothetical protein